MRNWLAIALSFVGAAQISTASDPSHADGLVLFSLLRHSIAFDGGESGAGWESLQKATGFVNLQTKDAAREQTDARSAYDATAVYFWLEMKEELPTVSDAVEVWLNCEGDGKSYYQFIVDRNGTLKTYIRRLGEVQPLEISCEFKVKCATGKWSAQIRIPFLSLHLGVPPDNSKWGFNINRRWHGEGKLEELSSWAAVGAFDQTQRFGKLAFYSKAEVAADMAYWENNNNDPLMRRSAVSGVAIQAAGKKVEASSSLWAYDPFSANRSSLEKWGCSGLTSELFAQNRGRAKSAEKDFPDFYRAADAINHRIIELSECRLAIDQLERATHYARNFSSGGKINGASYLDGPSRTFSELKDKLNVVYGIYTEAFRSDWNVSMLKGTDESLAKLEDEMKSLRSDTSEKLRELQTVARQDFAWTPEDATIEYSDAMRNANGAPQRFWFSAYGLQGTEPVAAYFGPFRSWNVDWPSLLASRGVDGSFSRPFADRAMNRLASPELKINFQTGIGLVSYQMPTSDWLEQRISSDPSILAQSQDGIEIPKVRVGAIDAFMRRGVNIENPAVQDYAKDYLRYAIENANNSGRVDFVVNGWEDRTELRISQNGKVSTRERGYDPFSRKSFQEYLKKKYGTIDQLCKRWKVDKYRDFSDIAPPDDPHLSVNQKASGLSYEWESWQRKSHFQWGQRLRAFVKESAPELPVMTDSSHLLMEGAGWEAMQEESTDILSYHGNPTNEDAMFAYLGSLARRKGLPLACFENYDLMYSRLEGDDEILGARAMRRHFFDLISRDVRALTFWLGYQAGATSYIAAYGGANFRLDSDQTILRWPAAEVPVFMREAQRLERFLVESTPARGKIAVIIPDSSFLQTQYLQGDREKGTSMDPFIKFQNAVLSEKSLPAEYFHEDELAEGTEDLSAYNAVVIQDASFLRREALAKLQTWAAQPGKQLFVVGALGFFDEFGQTLAENESPLRSTFHGLSVQGARPWALNMPPSAGGAMETKPFGLGKITRLTGGLDEVLSRPEQLKQLQAMLLHAAGDAAMIDNDHIRFQVREDSSGHTYVLVSNRDVHTPHEFQMNVKGSFPKIFDVGVPGWFPVASNMANERTAFRSYLAPGDWTLFRLDGAMVSTSTGAEKHDEKL